MESIRQIVLSNLPHNCSDGGTVDELSSMAPRDLLVRWFNWSNRLPTPTPRQVIQSNEFAANPILQIRRSDIQALIDDIESGADLTKYLSRAVRDGYVKANGQRPHQRRDLDLMLNAWGVHHLHFSQEVEPDGFVRRDGPIIFAVFRSDKAFMIDIMSHDDWTSDDVIRVMVSNWPEQNMVVAIGSAHNLAFRVDEHVRKTLRKKSVNDPIEIDGRYYLAAAGLSGSGVGLNAVRQADYVMKGIKAFVQYYEKDPGNFAKEYLDTVADWPEEPDFVVEFRPSSYGVVETKSRTYLKLGP